MSDNETGNRPGTPSPGDFIREELRTHGWTQQDLAGILGRPLPTVNEIIVGKRAIMPEMARALGEAFGTSAELWMARESAYRLSLADGDFGSVRRRARLYEMAPLKELQKRGWIRKTDDESELESELINFFGVNSLDEDPGIVGAMRKSNASAALSPSQRAWCVRVGQLARSMLVSEFKAAYLPRCERELRKIAAYSPETRKVPEILAAHGIRFVVVEPLAGAKIDGFATWLNEDSPVIGMSVRYDRIDNFWHTLCHEYIHIKHKDMISVDIFDEAGNADELLDIRPAIERRADEEASCMLIPKEEIESFIRRLGPLYSKERINQMANRIKIHPGIIVGQLQKRGEIGYSANREMLVKVRHIVTPVALTDGWGNTIDPRITK